MNAARPVRTLARLILEANNDPEEELCEEFSNALECAGFPGFYREEDHLIEIQELAEELADLYTKGQHDVVRAAIEAHLGDFTIVEG